VVEHRLQVFQEMTLPLLEYYAGREWMFTVDGGRPADAVHADIAQRIERMAALTTSPSP
jgi:adenylate kinase family enzyme